MNPRVSIGIPVYNGERYIEEALDSILSQTFTDMEIIVSDNASTDRTREIVQDFAAGDKRIILRKNERNLGAAPNYNLLVDIARGEYFKWAAHDDNLAPTYIERCVKEFESRPDVILCYPSTIMIDAEGRPTGSDPMDALDVTADRPHQRFAAFMSAAWPQLGCNAVFGLIRTATLRSTRLIGSYASSDKILLGELALLGKFSQLPEQLFLRREHQGSSVRANPGVEERNLWFNVSTSGMSRYIRWRWVAEYTKGIFHVPIPVSARFLSLGIIWNHIRNDRQRLIGELKRPVRDVFRGRR